MSAEAAALNQWYTVGALKDFGQGTLPRRLLGEGLSVTRQGERFVVSAGGRFLTVKTDYGHLWTSLGTPARGLFEMPEAKDPDRRAIYCGAVTVRASGLRLVEGILDGIEDVSFNRLTAHDVVRHKLVGKIVAAYDEFDARAEHRRTMRSGRTQ